MKKKVFTLVLSALMAFLTIPGVAFGVEDGDSDFPATPEVPEMTEIYGLHETPKPPANEGDEIKDNLILNKIVKEEEDGLNLYLEAYAKGHAKQVPTEVSIIVDRSGSMYSAIDTSETWNYEEFLKYANAETSPNKENWGYYVVMTTNQNYGGNGPDKDMKYAVALLKFDGEKWVRTQQVPIADEEYEKVTGGFIFPNANKDNPVDLAEKTGTVGADGKESYKYPQYVGEKAVFFKSIYGATIDALDSFIDNLSKLEDCKVALVGFSSSSENAKNKGGEFLKRSEEHFDGRYMQYGGTGVFVKDEFIPQYACTADTYKKAFMDIKKDRIAIENAIDSIDTNYFNTTTDAGFEMVNEIYRANPVENGENGENVNRIVALFTDGVPDSFDGVTPAGYWDPENIKDSANHAIADSFVTKNIYEADVYAFGPANLGEGEDEVASNVLKALSSYNTTVDNLGALSGVTGDTSFYKSASDGDDLKDLFGKLGKTIYEKSVGLGPDAFLQDVIADGFHIEGTPTAWTEKCVEDAFVPKSAPDTEDSKDKALNITVNEKTIKVDGFDYSENSITPEGGYKLVVKVPIAKDAENGDKNVPTNTTVSGIYDSNGNVVNYFRVPQVDFKTPTATVTVKKLTENGITGEFEFDSNYVKAEYNDGYEDNLKDVIDKADETNPNSYGGNYLALTETQEAVEESFRLNPDGSIDLNNVKTDSSITVGEKLNPDRYTTRVEVTTADGTKSYDVTENEDGFGEVTLNVENGMVITFINTAVPAQAGKELTVEKVWNDEGGNITSAPDGITGIEVELFTVGENGEKTATGIRKTLNDENGWKETFTDLDEEVNYTVEEITKVDGYKATVEAVDGGFVITNSPIELPPPVPTPDPDPDPTPTPEPEPTPEPDPGLPPDENLPDEPDKPDKPDSPDVAKPELPDDEAIADEEQPKTDDTQNLAGWTTVLITGLTAIGVTIAVKKREDE